MTITLVGPKIAKEIKSNSRGVIVVGPGTYDYALRGELSRLAETLNWPMFPDVLSNLRQDPDHIFGLVGAYEFLLRNRDFANSHRPE